jgi:hypothetical protein
LVGRQGQWRRQPADLPLARAARAAGRRSQAAGLRRDAAANHLRQFPLAFDAGGFRQPQFAQARFRRAVFRPACRNVSTLSRLSQFRSGASMEHGTAWKTSRH